MMPEKKHYSYTNLADTPQVSGKGKSVLCVVQCRRFNISTIITRPGCTGSKDEFMRELPFARLKLCQLPGRPR